VTRGAGVGDGEGESVGFGDGDEDGVWPSASKGVLAAATPATPSAGSTFTKLRLPTLVVALRLVFFFMDLIYSSEPWFPSRRLDCFLFHISF